MFDKNRVDGIITNYYEESSGANLAEFLKKAGLTTQRGKAWTQANVSYYALKVLGLDRKNKEFTKSVAQKQDSVLTPEVKTENLTEVKNNDLGLVFKTVQFNGVELVGVKLLDGRIFTPIKKICDDLGIDHSGQIERIKRDDLYIEGTRIIRMPSFKGGNQDTFCLDIQYLPSFLTGIQTSKCKPEVQPILKDFKLKAKDILAEAFIKKEVEQPKPALYTSELDLIIASANQIKVIAERQTQTELKVNSLENKVNNIIVNFPKKRNYNPQPIHQDTLFEMEEKTLSYQAKTYKRVMAYSIHINTPENRIFNSIYAIFDDAYNKDIKKECEIYNLRNKTKFSILSYIDFIGMSKELWEVTQNNLLFNVQKVGS